MPLALHYLGLAVGLSLASILFSIAYKIWRYKPEKRE
jgi:hypothetical protein